jgi:crotonobetainyl-CoA:carnitine CoA-transferase CaiB-like acyl-CoA transferase
MTTPGEPGALSDVRVLEFGTGIAARFAAHVFSMLGANVVQVVEPGSAPVFADGPARVWQQAQDLYLNDGKQVVEYSSESAEFAELVRRSDIAVRGLDPAPPGGAPALRAEYERWRAYNDRIVYVAMSPFGVTGPAAAYPAGDIQAQALSGWPTAVGFPDAAPLHLNYGLGPMLHGLHGLDAVLASLVNRDDDSPSEFIDVAAADVTAVSVSMYRGTYRMLDLPMRRAGYRAPGSAGRYPFTTWNCKDGLVLIIVRSEAEWARFLAMVGNPAWADQDRYKDLWAMAVVYPQELDDLLAPWLMARTRDEIAELARQHSVALAPIRRVDEVLEDEQFAYRRFFKPYGPDGSMLPGLPVVWTRSGG